VQLDERMAKVEGKRGALEVGEGFTMATAEQVGDAIEMQKKCKQDEEMF
jgi:uncharacterized membrane protein (UPF0127 family)